LFFGRTRIHDFYRPVAIPSVPAQILLFSMAAVYIIPYSWNRFMGKPLLALLVIGTFGFFHINDSLFLSYSINSTAKNTIPVPLANWFKR